MSDESICVCVDVDVDVIQAVVDAEFDLMICRGAWLQCNY